MANYYSNENLMEIADGDEEFLKTLAQTFLEEITLDLSSVVEAIENENRELAYQFAHKMKPNVEMFGIDALKEISTIEGWSQTSKNVNNVIPHMQNLQAKLNLVFEELKQDFQL